MCIRDSIGAATSWTGVGAVGGVLAVGAGVLNVANSAVGLRNSGRNFLNALSDDPQQLPSSGSGMIAETFFPGNQTAAKLSIVADLTLALVSGRLPVAMVQSEATVWSALSNAKPTSINGMLDATAAAKAIPSTLSGVLTPAANGASKASRALDITQGAQVFASVDDAVNPPEPQVQNMPTLNPLPAPK